MSRGAGGGLEVGGGVIAVKHPKIKKPNLKNTQVISKQNVLEQNGQVITSFQVKLPSPVYQCKNAFLLNMA